MAKRKQIDWEAIEREYRAGQKSLREIGRGFDCTEGAIRKKAKACGWERDLADRVRKRVREKLVRKKVRISNISDEEIIETNADEGVQLVFSHRKDIAALQELEEQLIAELKDNPTKLYITQYQGEIVQKTVGLTASERSAAANNLANVQHKRIQLERQAFNLDEPENSDKPREIKLIYDDKIPMGKDVPAEETQGETA